MKKERYKCNQCGKIVLRDPMVGGDGVIRKTPRVWMKSFCETLGKYTRLYRFMSTKEKRLKHEQDYVAFLERRVNSKNFQKNASPEEVEEAERKLKKARLVLKVLQK